MIADPKWLSLSAVIAIHERLIAEHGGPAGMRDINLLESALAAPVNRFVYGESDFFVLTAVYAHAISRNHPFVDGNKRVALTSSGIFLMKNGYRVELPEMEAVAITLALAAGEIGLEDYANWLREKVKPGE